MRFIVSLHSIRLLRGLLLAGIVLGQGALALAQSPLIQGEEVEPRIVGRQGVTQIGLAGFIDKFSSSEEVFPFNFTVQGELSRFVTRRLVARVGVVGTGRILTGDEDDGDEPGSGAHALHLSGGAFFYFTPESMASLYVGGEYWYQLTRRAGDDSGTVLGIAGLQAAVSSRASAYIQAGAGVRTSRGGDDELLSRVTAQVGFRLRF